MKGSERYSRRLSAGERRQRRFFLVSFFVLILAVFYFFVSFLDVGQGDSILVRSEANAILIDGGEHRNRNVVLYYLREAGVERLDYVVATHPHSDHIGGLITILRDFEVGALIMPEITNNTVTFENFLEAIENNEVDVIFPGPGDRMQAGIINMTVISPPAVQGETNNSSVVLRMEHGETAFIFTGDAEIPAERWMTANIQSLHADVLKIGHHGSRTSTSEEFLSAVNPAYAVISVAASNQYNHPHDEILARIEAHGAEILRTDQLGTIRMITNGQSIYFPEP
jgi:DNA internalization-related competence protein ComEC/Rec2